MPSLSLSFHRPFLALGSAALFALAACATPKPKKAAPPPPRPAERKPLAAFEVAGKGAEMKCRAFLHLPKKAAGPLPLLYEQPAAGAETTAHDDDLSETAQTLLDEGRVAVLSIDKPGIESDPAFRVDDAVYDRYRQGDLVECAKNALKAVAKRPEIALKRGVLFAGTGEGAQVAARTYAALLREKSPIARRTRGLFLSAPPMGSWKELVDFRYKGADNQRFWGAYSEKDDLALRGLSGLPYAYWDDVLAAPSLGTQLRKLAANAPRATVHLDHAIDDAQIPVKPVMDFESWNRGRSEKKRPALRLVARYYPYEPDLAATMARDRALAMKTRLENAR